MAAISGQRLTSNVASSQRVVDMKKDILLLEPDAAPLTVILKQIQGGSRVRPARDTTFKWHEDELETRFDAINNGAGYNSAATSIVVDNGDLFPTESLVKVPRTGEILYVSAVSTNTLTVTRGFGGTTAAALVDNDPVFVIGTVHKEGDTSPTARTYNPTAVTNYTEIFRTSVEASGSWMSSSNESSPHDWAYQHKKKGIEHLKNIELALLYGGAGSATVSSRPVRSTGGILQFATQNNQDAGGTLTETEWEQFLRTVFRYGSQTKTLFASPLLVSVLNAYSSGKLNTVVGATTYGVKVMEFYSAHGTVKLVRHNLLEGATYGGYGILVDFAAAEVAFRPLAGDGPGESRDTKLLTNRQENDRDGQKDEWLTEAGLQFPLPKVHGVLTGVTG